MTYIKVQKLVFAVKECRDPKTGEELHQEAISRSLHDNKYVVAALIKMYSRLHDITLARQVFDTMKSPDVVAWNTLILAYVDNGESPTAMDVYTSMDCEASFVTFVAAAQACKTLPLDRKFCLDKGIKLHKELHRRGFHTNVVLANSLIDMYSRCGSLEHARRCFETMNERSPASWNSLLQGYVDNGESLVALDLFEFMDCEPTSVTYVVVLKACLELFTELMSREFCVAKAIVIHRDVKRRGFHSDVLVGTSLLDLYGKCGNMRLAREVFDGMPQRNIITWTSLIQGYVENGDLLLALGLFCSLDFEPDAFMYATLLKACGKLACEDRWFSLHLGVSLHRQARISGFEFDTVVSAALVDMYRRCGSTYHARAVFENMRRRSVPAWNSIILAYVDAGDFLQALSMFTCMDCEPSSVTFIAVLKSWASLSRQLHKLFCLELGVAVHKRVIVQSLQMDVSVATALINMYSKCSISHARRVFDGMPHKDVVVLTSLIVGYVENGEMLKAMELFVSIDCEPNALTYTAGIKACGHLGAVEPGGMIHGLVCRAGLEKDQVLVTALVDFYGRCGSVSRAEVMFGCMHTVDVVSWDSMIAAYSAVGDTARVFGLVGEMQEAGVRVDGPTLGCILTMCSHAGLVDVGKRCLERLGSFGGGVAPVERYNSLVDGLSRAGQLEDAAALVSEMPCEADQVTWTSLLGAYRLENPEVGRILLQ